MRSPVAATAIDGPAAALFVAGIAARTRGKVLCCLDRPDLFALPCPGRPEIGPVINLNVQRHLTSARTHRALRTAAMNSWREVVAVAGYFSRKMTIKAICRDLRVSRKVVRKLPASRRLSTT
jgi:hypothetical protein